MPDQSNRNLAGHSVSIWPTAWKWALIVVAFKLIYGYFFQATGLGGIPGIGLVGVIITVVLLVIALQSYRRVNHGYMTFGQGFGIGFVASVVPTVVNAAVTAVNLGTLGQERLADQLAAAQSQLRANPAVDEQAAEVISRFFETVFTPAGIFISGTIAGTIGWTIVALILAAVLKKPPPITD